MGKNLAQEKRVRIVDRIRFLQLKDAGRYRFCRILNIPCLENVADCIRNARVRVTNTTDKWSIYRGSASLKTLPEKTQWEKTLAKEKEYRDCGTTC